MWGLITKYMPGFMTAPQVGEPLIHYLSALLRPAKAMKTL